MSHVPPSPTHGDDGIGGEEPDLPALMDDPTGHLRSTDASVRRLAVAASVEPLGEEAVIVLAGILAADPEPVVRAEAAEALGRTGSDAVEPLLAASDDPDVRVVEAVATALGELEDPRAVPWLLTVALDHPDRLVREAAVASLGAIGDPVAVPTLLELVVSGPPQVRRRTVVALTAFDDPAVEGALRTAAEDRNPMVREVAEMTVGRKPDEGWPDDGDGRHAN